MNHSTDLGILYREFLEDDEAICCKGCDIDIGTIEDMVGNNIIRQVVNVQRVDGEILVEKDEQAGALTSHTEAFVNIICCNGCNSTVAWQYSDNRYDAWDNANERSGLIVIRTTMTTHPDKRL